MAPRPPESKAAFIERLTRAAEAGEEEVRLGVPHNTHAVCREGELWSVRRLRGDRLAEQAFLAEHGYFMPEHAEMLSKPGPVVVEARPLAELLPIIEARYPFDA